MEWALETRYSPVDGKPYKVWTSWRLRMPRLGEGILDCAVYFYASVQDARDGRNAGGSGFLLGVPMGLSEPLEVESLYDRTTVVLPGGTLGYHVRQHIGGTHIYAVTNPHIVKQGYNVARLNTKVGRTREIKLDTWVHHPDLDEVSISPLVVDPQTDQFSFVEVDQLVSQGLAAELSVGPGDEVFLVGRFIDHAGKQVNRPAIRYGFLSVMPHERVQSRLPDGSKIGFEAYLVEARSQSGFSGAPAFLYCPPWQLLSPELGDVHDWNRRKVWEQNGESCWLLGINYGHMLDRIKALELDANREPVQELELEMNSGLLCVAPAWKILDVLNLEELREQRKKELKRREDDGLAVLD